MGISLAESQAVNEIAKILYNFLPGKPHPYANQDLSFPGVARGLGLGNFWSGGSKLPAITQPLTLTLEARRDRFCDLIIGIIRTGMMYRNSKPDPIQREEIQKLNDLLKRVEFKIPELRDPKFIDSLPLSNPIKPSEKTTSFTEQMMQMREELIGLTRMSPQQRGFAFEKILNRIFEMNGLSPRSSFRLIGEQIDGSFQLGSDVYLVEAKWTDMPIGESDLLTFYGKVGGKSIWSRGLFVSHSGFTRDGIEAFSRGRPTNMIGMDGQDLYFILEGMMSLREALEKKTRIAGETGLFFVRVYDLLYS